MSRRLAGVFDPGGRTDVSVAAGALSAEGAETFSGGPLQLAYSGPRAGRSGPLCLLDGYLDNAADLARELAGGASRAEPPISDEELLGAGYRRWGIGLLGRMRGDFVLLVWDDEREEGLIARDQLGVRPAFVAESGGTLRFATEVRDLLAMLPIRPPPDPAGVAHWIAVSTRPGPETLYAGVRRLAPGEALLLGPRGSRAERYWSPRFEQPLDLPPGELAAEVREALEAAVRRRLAPDGRMGVLMSGGLDSSSVAALCADAAGGGEVWACSATFPDHLATDESELIGELREALGLSGLNAEVRPGGLLASALEHLAAWQMPLLSWGDFWTLPLMRAAAAEGVETMLDGDGGDELFGPRSYLLADRLRAGHPLQALALAGELPGAGPHVPRREVMGVLSSVALAGALPHWLHNLGRAPLAKRDAPSWLRRKAIRDLAASDDAAAWKRLGGPRWWAHAAHGVTRGIDEAGFFEHQRRRAAMAGLDARHPLFDFDLVKLCLRQPPRATLDRRFTRPVLRSSMAGLLPDSVRLRPAKARFESLVADCLTGPDRAAVWHILARPDAEIGAYVDLAAMRRALLDTDRQLRDSPFHWMWQVWRLLTMELWLRSQASQTADPGLDSPLSHARVSVSATRTPYLFPP
jgi:asparagine synthase (glutamine-hydrolysing)